MMKNSMKTVKLDILSIKPYMTLKNLMMLIFFSALYTIITKRGDTVAFIISFMAMMYTTYPFMVGEDSGIDNLYRISGIGPEDVVKGRYLYVFMISFIAAAVGTVLSVIISSAMGKPIGIYNSLGVFAISFMIVTFFAMIQLPLFFRLGYLKARSIVGITYFIVMIILVGFGSLIKGNLDLVRSLNIKPVVFIIIALFLYIASGMISYVTALKSYRKREF